MKITDLIPWRGSARDGAPPTTTMDPMRALQMDVDRAFDHFWRMVPPPFATLGRLPQANAVRVDVDDDGKAVTVTAELPGMSETDVDVSLSDGTLTIRGQKTSDRDAEAEGILIRERAYGLVERTVPLPDGLDPDAAEARFANGVLTIVIPKSAELQASTRRIPVQAG